MKNRSGFHTMFISLGFLFAMSSQSFADCAKAKVLEGPTCSKLKVSFDLSACEDGPKDLIANSRCRGDKAVSKTTHDGKTYSATFTREEGGWGEAKWTLVGKIKETGGDALTPKNALARSQEEGPVQSAGVVVAATATEKTELPPPLVVKAAEPAKLAEPKPEAQTAATEPPATREVASAPASGITLGGLFDVYYAYNFNRPALPAAGTHGASVPNKNLRSAQNLLRTFDIYHDQFSLNLAALTVKMAPNPIGFRADFGFGQLADQLVTNDDVSKHIPQAYVTMTPSWAPGLQIDVGKMYTHMGLETTYAIDNFNYSRSMLFSYSIPFWHVGLHVGYALIADKLTLNGYLYNGWGTDLYPASVGKTFGGQVSFIPVEGVTTIYNIITGPDLPSNSNRIKTVHDFNVSWVATKKLTVAGDFVYGQQKAAGVSNVWSAGEALLKYTLTDYYAVSPRFELYNDRDGATTGTAQTVWGFTATNSFDCGKGLELRAEFRIDKSNKTPFTDSKGVASATQATVSASALYKF